MDEIVKQAMAKWPNVPHCYGWLALDARGNWRMRDERAQALKLPGEKINHPTLLDFINRNYGCDERGCWFFQNGPQRVFVTLEAAPYIARTAPGDGFVLHTGEAMAPPQAAWLSEEGQLWLQAGKTLAMLDDRDLADCMARIEMAAGPVTDDALLAWLAADEDAKDLFLNDRGRKLPLARIEQASAAQRFGFVKQPSPA